MPTTRPHPKRRTRAERQAQTRAQLIDAAAKVFARQGYAAASVEQIAEQAGYSHGAVYSNFGSKEDLFLAVFETYMQERVREVAQRTAVEGPLAMRAREGANQWMKRFSDDKETFLLHLEFIVHAARNPRLSRQLGGRMAALRGEIERQLLERERQGGEPLPLPAADLALIMRALGIGLAVEALNQPPDEVKPGLYGDFVGLVANLLEPSVEGSSGGSESPA